MFHDVIRKNALKIPKKRPKTAIFLNPVPRREVRAWQGPIKLIWGGAFFFGMMTDEGRTRGKIEI